MKKGDCELVERIKKRLRIIDMKRIRTESRLFFECGCAHLSKRDNKADAIIPVLCIKLPAVVLLYDGL